jgi:aryl-alcohol dehydrogenase-like predicted oxidoreductase
VKRVLLGRTGLEVSRLGLGGLWLQDDDQPTVNRVVAAAVAAGINYVDTAPGYGASEAVLGYALARTDDVVVVSTKLGGRPEPFNPQSASALIDSVRTSCELLGRDRIDMLMIHEPDRTGQYNWWTDPLAYDGPVWEAIAALRTEGTVGAVGIGGTTVTELARLCASGRFDVVLTAFNHSLLWREASRDLIPVARAHGMGIIAGSPLQGGALAVRRDDALRHGAPWLNAPRRAQLLALGDLCDESGIDLPSMAMRWMLASTEVDVVLTGVKNERELAANLAALHAGALPDDVSAAVDDLAARIPFRPTLEPFILPFDDRPVPQGPLR